MMKYSMLQVLRDKANLITLANCGIGFIGLLFVNHGLLNLSLCTIMISFFLDHVDGSVARKTPSRPDEFQQIGGGLDSFSDFLNFGLVPAMVNYSLGDGSIFSLLAGISLVLTSVTRLSYYNVFGLDGDHFIGFNTTYSGGAVVLACIALSLLSLSQSWLLSLFILILAALQISQLRVPKHSYSNWWVFCFSLTVSYIAFMTVDGF